MEREALDAARGVAWPCLTATVAVAIEWEVLSLWLRAVGNAAGEIPPAVTAELSGTGPDCCKRLAAELVKLPVQQDAGDLAWEQTGSWVERNVLHQAANIGWLAAVRYYAARSIAYMQAWSHWNKVDIEWSTTAPSVWPSLSEWRNAVTAVRTLSNPGSLAQEVLAGRYSVTDDEWSRLLSQFRTIMAFSLWLEVALETGSETALAELTMEFPDFPSKSTSGRPAAVVRRFHRWAIQRLLKDHEQGATRLALQWHVQYCPEYGALRRYAAHCRRLSAGRSSIEITGFDQWRKEAELYLDPA